MPESLAIASNNIELLRQLDEAGWPADALERTQQVYKTVALLSSGTFRPNWKPFSAHLVGVASIVAWDSHDPIHIGAAMAHSALEFGRFPLFSRWPFDRRAAFLRNHLGGEILRLVRAYAQADWKTLMTPPAAASKEAIAVQHIKLADLLDDMEDERSPVSTRKKLHIDLGDAGRVADCIELARQNGCPQLAKAYQRLGTERVFAPAVREARDRTFVLKGNTREIA